MLADPSSPVVSAVALAISQFADSLLDELTTITRHSQSFEPDCGLAD